MVGKRRRHAEIAGAGIAGLVAATALAQRGWSVCVHERAAHIRGFGAGISIWYNFAKVLQSVGALRAVRASGHVSTVRETRDGRNRVLYSFATTPSATEQLFVVTRPHLLNTLAEAARSAGAEVRCDSHVVGADPRGMLRLASGETREAAIVIGADGVNSAVRDSVALLSKRILLPEGTIRMLVPRLTGPEGHAEGLLSVEHWHGHRRIYQAACSDHDLYLAFGARHSDEHGKALPLQKETWVKSFPHLESLIDRVGNQGRWDRLQNIRLARWSNGRVAMLGDAAHAMTADLGQGGGMAATNALALAHFLGKTDRIEDSLAVWEQSQRPLTDYTQRFSRLYGRMNALPPSLRATLMLLAGKSRWIVGLRQRAANHMPIGFNEVGGPAEEPTATVGR